MLKFKAIMFKERENIIAKAVRIERIDGFKDEQKLNLPGTYTVTTGEDGARRDAVCHPVYGHARFPARMQGKKRNKLEMALNRIYFVQRSNHKLCDFTWCV